MSFPLVASVNGGRMPALRREILDDTFQQTTCHACDTPFRLEPHLTYLDVGRSQWIAIWPGAEQHGWRDREGEARALFEKSFGSGAPAAARAVGSTLRPRLVFGWAALREKLLAEDAGIDDVTLELVKLALLRRFPEEGERLSTAALRLVGFTDELLELAWVDRETERAWGTLELPRQIGSEIEDAPDAWLPLRQSLGVGLFTDLQRSVLPGSG